MDDNLPGVLFRLMGLEKSKTQDGQLVMKVNLRAEVHDEKLWDEVRLKLQDGLKIYTINDFKTEVAEMLRKENVRLESKAEELEKAYNNLLSETKKMREAMEVLGSNLGFGVPE